MRGFVDCNSTVHLRFKAIFAGFGGGRMRLDSCNKLGRGGWILNASWEGLRATDVRDVKR